MEKLKLRLTKHRTLEPLILDAFRKKTFLLVLN